MSLVNLPVPALHNGVSQQSPVVRSTDQGEEQINGWSSLADGLLKRAPATYVNKLMSGVAPGALVYHINRDASERYIVIAYGGQLRVFDTVTGLEQTVLAPAGWGYSYLDWFGAYSMALSVLAALYHREQTGEGQWIDASQTEAGIMLTQVPVLDWSANGRAWERTGNRSAYEAIAPQGIYRCAGDDRWLAVTCATEGQWQALATAAGHGEWLADVRFATVADRLAHHDDLDVAISAWTAGNEPYELMLKLQAAGIPAGVCQTAGDRCDNDPQLSHLGWLTELTGTRIGRWPLAEVPVRMSRTPPYLGGLPDRAAPLYGEDNAAILTGLLGMSAEEVAELTEQGVL